MALKLYNTLTRQIEEFKPTDPRAVKMYTCGPTVYGPAHIGNLRTFVVSDWLKRTLVWNNYNVKAVMNITDVDDKTIKGAQTASKPLLEFTKEYEKLFLADLEKLNVLPPNELTHATEYVSQMISLVQELLEKGFAYRTEDGVYFSVAKFSNYGQLAKLSPNTAQTISRIQADEYDKDAVTDFALWKFWQENDGDVSWDAPFGKGRPGWHIECSAMIRATLGDTIDIHLGGSDLVFPHHTNEIAQSEAATGQTLSRYWIHTAFVNMAGGKMAKSDGNIVTLNEVEKKGYSPLAYRFWLLSAHYRTHANFTWEALEAAATGYKNLLARVYDLSQASENKTTTPNEKYLAEFSVAINNDLNLPQTLATVWHLLKTNDLPPAEQLATILKMDEVLGLDLIQATVPIEIPSEVQALAAEREVARQNGDWSLADELRRQIEALDWYLLDSPTGPQLRKK